jgi:hypothetical protein
MGGVDHARTSERTPDETHQIRGRVYIYACKALGAKLNEMAEINKEFGTHLDLKTLGRRVLIGTVEIVDCKKLGQAHYEWIMKAPARIDPCSKPTGFPQPSFFNPFPQTKQGTWPAAYRLSTSGS